MEFLNFPIVALGAALICLIGVTIYAITQRGTLRSRDEQLVVARAQAYAMLELSQAGVLFLDREHKLMGEASSAAPELLGHTCGAGTAFVQVIADLVEVGVRRETVAFLETMWKADPSTQVDATQNPLSRVHSGTRHLALRFSRLVVDGRVHHIIVSIERIAAPRVVPHTIEVPALNEDTFARRLAGETGTRPALKIDATPVPSSPAALEMTSAGQPAAAAVPAPVQQAPAAQAAVAQAAVAQAPGAQSASELPPMLTGEFELGPLDVTADSVPSVPHLGNPAVATMAALAQLRLDAAAANSEHSRKVATLAESLPTHGPAPDAVTMTLRRLDEREVHLATTITSPDVANEVARPPAALAAPVAPVAPVAPAAPPEPDPASIIDPPDPRLNEVLKEIMSIEAERLEHFLAEAREKAGQLRAIIKLPAREPQAFREKLVLILELIRGIKARAQRLPLPSVCERAERFEAALGGLRDKQTLSGNDFLPLAVKLDDLLSHLAIQGEVITRLREWRVQNGLTSSSSIDATQRSATATGTTIRQPLMRGANASSNAGSQPGATTQKTARLSDLSQESLEEMAAFLADMYSKRVSLVVVGLEDVPRGYRRAIEKILGQLIHNAIRHGVEAPADRLVQDKPEIGTVAVQFVRAGAEGYQLSVQDDGRGLDHDKIRAEAVRQGVLTAEAAANIDPRKLSGLIFRPGFTTVSEGARGIGMDVVRDLVNKAGGKVGIATKPGEYTRFRISLPHEKKASDAAA